MTDFPVENLPFGVFNHHAEAHIGVAFDDHILDLHACVRAGLIDEPSLLAPRLNEFMSRGRAVARDVRARITELLTRGTADEHLVPMSGAEMLLPMTIGDYTDFYASIYHATNVGSMFRPDNPLLPNYKWLPVAYHGRASSIVLSGTPVRRPWGEISDSPAGPPEYAPTRRLDYELEIGAFLGPGNGMGEPIPAGVADDHIVGLCLLNDWSARDIQAWEYQPLGPFLAKSFATSISPWIVTTEALDPFRCPPDPRPESDPQPLLHLSGRTNEAFRIVLEVWLRTARMTEPVKLSSVLFDSMYWTLAQMVTHHTSNGCNIRPGDLIGSGTVSGPEKESRGCLLELAWRGTEPVKLPTGEERSFLEDGDEVILRGWCESSVYRRIGFGECRGVVLPAISKEEPEVTPEMELMMRLQSGELFR